MDRPSDPVWTYTNANVINGEFTYQYSAMKSRHNAIQVEYSDAANNYEKAIEYVSDDDLIRRYGLNLKKVTAFGCTSRGQAHRTGLWLLQTEKLETKTVTFSVGMEGLMHIPGDIIQVADSHYAGTEIGGRVLGINGKTVTLDREITFTPNSYFSYINQNAQVTNIRITAVSGANITLANTPTGLQQYGVWSLATEEVVPQLFRALSVTEEEKGKYTITALQHEPQKEAIVDNGAHFEPKPTRIKMPTVNSVQIDIDGNQIRINADVSGGDDVVKYDIRIYKAGKLYEVKLGLTSPTLDLNNLPDGEYSVVIVAKNAKGQVLSEKTQTFTIDRPPVPTGVAVTGGLGNITLEWDWVNEITQTEIFVAESDNIRSAVKIAQVSARTFTHEVGAKQVRYYWLRHRRGRNIGPFYSESGVRGESSVDVDAELALLNEKLSKNLINEVIDTALPARNLELTKTVANLNFNKFNGYKQVYNQADGKLYIWNGKVYRTDKEELLASAIKGIIQPNQLAQIPTSQLSGKLTDSQIQQVNAAKLVGTVNIANVPTIPTSKLAGTVNVKNLPQIPTSQLSGKVTDAQLDAVSASKINGTININAIPSIPTNKLTGQINDRQLQSVNASKISGTLDISTVPSIPTTKLTGTVSDAQIGKISANKISGELALAHIPNIPTTKLNGTVSANQIAANAIGANHIGANAITADKIAANSIESGKIKANAIGANHIAANAITADKIAASAVNSDKIAANAITSGKISANAIGTNHLSANAITSEKIAANAIQARNIQTNAIRSGHIQANAIGAEHIKARTITASKLVMYGENMIQDPMFEDSEYWRENLISHATAENGVLSLTIANQTASESGSYLFGLRNKYNFPIDKGRSYRLQCRIKVTGDKRNECRTSIQLCRYTNLPNSETSENWSGNGERTEGNVKLGNRNDLVSIIVPSSFFADDQWQSMGIYLRIGTQSHGGTITKAQVEFSQLELIKMADSELIVDGAIIADKLASNSVSADKLQANSITSDKIAANAINANHIASRTITAREIASGSITAEKLAAAAVTAEKIAANAISAKMLQANSVGANAIQTSAISADNIQSNSITSAKISAGAIRADHLATGQVSTDKLAVGLGGNLLPNPILANDAFGWDTAGAITGVTGLTTFSRHYRSRPSTFTKWYPNDGLDTENVAVVIFSGNVTNLNTSNWIDVQCLTLKVVPNKHYIFSAYFNCYRCMGQLLVERYSSDGTTYDGLISSTGKVGNIGNGSSVNGTFEKGIAEANRVHVKFTAPDTGWISLRVRVNGWLGHQPYAYFARPQLEEVESHVTEPSPWKNQGVTSIHGGSIVANTITTQQLAANAVTANEIAAGAIATKHIATNSIHAQHIVSHSITTDKLNVGSLSAISANLGTVTAGTLKGIRIEGNTIEGGVIQGTTINGGTIKGARIEGITVEADNIIGDVIKMYSSSFDENTQSYTDIVIPASKRTRIAVLHPVAYSKYSGTFLTGSDDTRKSTYIKTYTIKMTQNGKKFGKITQGAVCIVNGDFTIPANKTATIKIEVKYVHKINNNTEYSTPVDIGNFFFIVTNA